MILTQINIVATDNTCTTSLFNLELHGNNMCVLINIAKYRVLGCKVPRHIPWIDQMNTPLTYKEQSGKNGPQVLSWQCQTVNQTPISCNKFLSFWYNLRRNVVIYFVLNLLWISTVISLLLPTLHVLFSLFTSLPIPVKLAFMSHQATN